MTTRGARLLVVALYLVMALAACGTAGTPISKGNPGPPTAPNPRAPTQTSTLPVAADVASASPSDDMVYVPAGEFLMGSDDDMEEEKSAHEVYLDVIRIDRTKVTFAQYMRFLNELAGTLANATGTTAWNRGGGQGRPHSL